MQTITKVEALARAAAVKLDTIDVALDLSGAPQLENLTFPSHTTLRFETNSSETFIDLIAQTVASVKVNGTPAVFEYNGARVNLQELPVNQPLEVEIIADCNYSTTGEGLHRYFDPEDGNTYLYTHFEPTDARRVFACFDQPGMKAKWQFSVVAPEAWVVLSNAPQECTAALENGNKLVHFQRTLPLSSYIAAVIAGEYAEFNDGNWQGSAGDGKEADIQLRLFCRQSLAKYFDTDDVFKQTRAGFDFFHANYGFTYPWGKYDQIYVPEYNIGAMENPGCVTFNENFISRDIPSTAHKQRRANVIFHEMCHMWFGDLVTPAWWDDLWLKESFADNQGSFGLAVNTEHKGEWASFAAGRKEWAYLQDQLPTTHPIAADIPDVEAAKHNFDGITYAKGASVLKQLVAYVGENIFFAGARKYFQKHAFESASMQDLLDALTEALAENGVTDRDLDTWQRTWIHTSSPSHLRLENPAGENNLVLSQHCIDATTGETVLRPHTLNLGFYGATGNLLHKQSVTLTGERITVEYPTNLAEESSFILPNDDDLTYAVIDLDEDAIEYCLANLSVLPTSLTRAIVWSALWAAVRNLKLSPTEYLQAVSKHLPNETEFAVIKDILRLANQVIMFYLPAQVRDSFGLTFADAMISTIETTENADVKQEWVTQLMSVLANLGKLNSAQAEFLDKVATNSHPNIEVGPTLTWLARIAQAAHGLLDADQIAAFLADDQSGEAKVAALKARAAIPNRNSRLNLWDQVVNEDLPNIQVSAILEGLAISGSKPGVVGLAGEFFGTVLDYWQTHSIGMGNRFVNGGYPLHVDASNTENTDALLYIAQNFLDAFTDAPAALRRLMIENNDILKLAVRIQRHWNDGIH
ncbi:membrane alanyl aminopeptidase [Gleimia coleocanis DSM 15436]|uniref:Aminopeptidase N n=1 Tax=Gleimia coleocanis DSM 15436 TaxID=525245 RepID=C0W1I5_9ACTO|nr:aminopeptidase N [Gleimia coleocanis]EEH63351.1 membrane alanyl aminopeptidase [Gleimia coleocanis DSM 15436]